MRKGKQKKRVNERVDVLKFLGYTERVRLRKGNKREHFKGNVNKSIVYQNKHLDKPTNIRYNETMKRR
jgi:hypothetical protein